MAPGSPRRRACLLAALAAAALGPACGFQLRRDAGLPFSRMAVSGLAPASPLRALLLQRLGQEVELVDDAAKAELHLRVLRDQVERSVVASTSAGQVREIQLRLLFEARADGADGRARMAPFSLRLTRELSYSEDAALAKQQEEQGLLREMRLDVVDQLLRRLAAVER